MQVKVWNDNDWDHVEKFQGKSVTVPSKGYVMMEYYDAIVFRGQFTGIRKDKHNQPLLQYRKMIRIEEPKQGQVFNMRDNFVCQADGKKFSSQKELDQHIEANYKDQQITDEEAELAAKAWANVIAEAQVKRGPGRPKRVETPSVEESPDLG